MNHSVDQDADLEAATYQAIVVTFNPDEQFPIRLEMVMREFQRVWVVNNGETLLLDASKLKSGLSRVQVIEMGCNAGIASAINEGVARAKRTGAVWAALFDQDSTCPRDYGATVKEATNWAYQNPAIAVFAPRFEDNGRTYQVPKSNCTPYPELDEAITSGCVVNVVTFQELGGYDSRLFIDFVDHDFSLRIIEAGFQLRSLPATMHHTIGRAERRSLLGRQFLITNHSPGRLFASGHNIIRLLQRHFMQFPAKCITLFIRELIRLNKIAFFEKRSITKMKAWLYGVLRALYSGNSVIKPEDLIR